VSHLCAALLRAGESGAWRTPRFPATSSDRKSR